MCPPSANLLKNYPKSHDNKNSTSKKDVRKKHVNEPNKKINSR